MKNTITLAAVAACLLASVSSFADEKTICTAASSATSGEAPAAGTPGTHFMMTAISPKCSANVHLSGKDGTGGAWYAVGSASAKGKTSFKGNTNGGAVQFSANCTRPGACVLTDASAARDVADSDAAGS